MDALVNEIGEILLQCYVCKIIMLYTLVSYNFVNYTSVNLGGGLNY